MLKLGCQMAFNEHTSPEYIAAAAAMVEKLGYDSFWVPEHVLFFPEYESKYPYSEDGRIQGDPRSLLDPLTALTYVAANTSKIRLGTGICLVPQRNPVYTAKQVADLDYLSGGRVDFGIGIGWLKEEFNALGVPWTDRAGRTEECIGVMKTLWCDELSSYQGKYFSFEAAYQNPKPVQRPHPPLIFGGESRAALRRVATLGQGWFTFNVTPESLAQGIDILQPLLEEQGRTISDISISVTPDRKHINQESLKRFEELGAEQIILPLFANNTDKLEGKATRYLELMQ
ncbi:MAG: LLM class F420-dependent oxidoreductase [Pseudomonadales bacterium]|jgi:probable F420-dependent oxidoreductase|nr:LLM class F420-dependent oxidoreductase [Pseudomonadales bacterium]MDG1001002.1 LLM class F420-dependent oxidoreductase [Pseudomonadales bacterium]MDG1305076.1 LLM class F420-dependent oxidoreductase [Pseudomonadales bacterium]MDG1909263.1 LLM class F420-dependent oxidoreductase [Pseudomonadales bacterium]|tara:strand:- start:1072 stop:1929 length:858 start_codon:yes stop_codon:yes gene_type:complete